MNPLSEVAPAFVEMAHRIVWASAATVTPEGRPFSRILHPIWEWDGQVLRGWIATGPTPLKRAHLDVRVVELTLPVGFGGEPVAVSLGVEGES